MILLEESWTEIFIISAIQWSLPFEKCSIFNSTNIPNSSEHSLDIRVLNDTFERFRNLSVTQAEFACLKALALFKPGLCALPFSSFWLILMQIIYHHRSERPKRHCQVGADARPNSGDAAAAGKDAKPNKSNQVI